MLVSLLLICLIFEPNRRCKVLFSFAKNEKVDAQNNKNI